MATVTKWTPFGVALDITATGGTVTRTSATAYTVKINASWETYYSGAKTNYGMTASSGGTTYTISAFNGTKRSSGSGSFTGTYSISGNGSATKTITVTFKNFNSDNGDTATKTVSFSVSVPAWTSYKIAYSANGGSGAPATQTKWKDQPLTLSSTKPTRAGYTFTRWTVGGTSYAPGAQYTANAAATLTASWTPIPYIVTYNANGGSGAPASQTKTYGVNLTLSSTKPARTNYNFVGWGTSASDTTAVYAAGGSYTKNASVTLYAIWELAYEKPKIKNLSIRRCTAAGEISDNGTYALVSFDWSIYETKTLLDIKVAWTSESGTEAFKSFRPTGTSGSISEKVGGNLSADATYKFVITVVDTGGRSTAERTLNSSTFAIDLLAENKGVAFGKAAELENTFDSGWLARFRDHVCIGEKTGHLDGNTGIFLSNEGYIQLQRSTAQNYNPYIAFLRDNETAVTTQIQLDVDTNKLKLLGADGYEIDGNTNVKGNLMLGNKTGYQDGNTGVFIHPDGYVQLQRSTANNYTPYVAFYLDNNTTPNGHISVKSDGNMYFATSAQYRFDGHVYSEGNMCIGYGTNGLSTAAVGSYWKDGAHHYVVEKNADGLTSAFGWAGSSSYATITKIRGRTCQCQNSSGTTALSDERLKKDFASLEKWDAFFNALEPCAFKMKAGTSGRYHLGFKAQQVEKALVDSGLTAQDFAGFVKMPYAADQDDPERSAVYETAGIKEGEDEYGLIYSEFTALNTFKIQQLQKENDELKQKVDDLESKLAKLESLLTVQGGDTDDH